MLRKLILPLIGVGMLMFALYHVVMAYREEPRLPPPRPPAQSDYPHTVAGAGLVEAQTENISLGAAVPGLVVKVHVAVGQKVKAGDPLFEQDGRHLQAELKVKQANLVAAQAQLAKLKKAPRPEELPASAARVAEARAVLVEKEDFLKRALVLYAKGAMAQEELVQRKQWVEVARAQLAKAEADDKLLKAGTWKLDLDIAAATVAQARSQLEQTETELDRHIVRAPVDGEALQVNVRPGEFAGAPPGKALLVLGGMKKLHVRVDIDENDIPRFQPGAPAVAKLRGNPKMEVTLHFVRVEPYVIPKKSLTGDNTERVDTRVLQVIYAAEASEHPLYVGQQLDVFIQSNTAMLQND